MKAIRADNLTKMFGHLVAVDSVSFKIFRGESFGFLGPNGAGKTTIMRMIQSVSPLTRGMLNWLAWMYQSVTGRLKH